MPETKDCNKCHQTMTIDNFYLNKGRLSGACKKCSNLANKIYREANQETVKAKKLIYSIANKEKLNETSRLWDIENHDRKLETMKTWAKSCPDKRRGYKAKRRELKSNASPSWLSTEELNQIEALYAKATQLTIETGIHHHVDHIIPIVSNLVCGLHCLSNLQIITAQDNQRKGNKFEPFVESENI